MFLKTLLLIWIALLVIFLAISTLYCLYIFIKYYNYWEKRGVPTEPNFLLANDIYKVFSGKMHVGLFFKSLCAKYPNEKYFGFYILGKPHLFMRDPKILKTITSQDFNFFENRSFVCDEEVDPIVAKCPFLSKNPEWKETRIRLNALFSPAKMKTMSPVISNTCEKMQSFLEKRDGEIVDMKEIAENLITNLLPLFFLGIDSNCNFEKPTNVIKLCLKSVFGKGIHQAFAFFCYIFIPKFVQWFNIRLCNFDYLKKMIEEMITFRKSNEIWSKDTVNLLIKTKEDLSDTNGNLFDENWLLSQALTFIVAGFIPTSSLFSFMLYELASHPKYQEQLRKEIHANFPLDNDPITYEKVSKMKYLSMITFETLRRHPFGGFMNRTCTQHYTIEETGLEIEEGTAIWASVDAIHTDTNYYQNPGEFDPERFRDGVKGMESAGTFIPFGIGPRRCLGEKFTHATTKIAVVHVLKKFRVELCDLTEKAITYDKKLISISAENGIKLRVHKLK